MSDLNDTDGPATRSSGTARGSGESESRPIFPMNANREGTRVLGYAPLPVGKTVVVARYGNVAEAEMQANLLQGEGIACEVIGRQTYTLGVYIGVPDVKVIVNAQDAEHAAAVLSRFASDDDFEPAEFGEAESTASLPADVTESGARLAPLEGFETVRAMRHAATTLAAARVPFVLPTLVHRGDRSAGEGRRFIVRVAEDQVGRARRMLDEVEADARDSNDPRCPRCGAWRVHRSGAVIAAIGALLGMSDAPAWQRQCECLVCRHRGPEGVFMHAQGLQ